MNHFGLVKNFTALALMASYRIAGYGADEGQAAQATGDEPYLGVTGVRGAAAANSRIDVYMDQIRDIEFGGVVAYGDWLTSDADGKAITAAPAADAQMNVIGRAMTAGVAGSIGKAHINPQQITG